MPISYTHVDKIITRIESKLADLNMKYPADSKMSSQDTKIYYILHVISFELQIMSNRWEQNT